MHGILMHAVALMLTAAHLLSLTKFERLATRSLRLLISWT